MRVSRGVGTALTHTTADWMDSPFPDTNCAGAG